ncbi:MAG: cytochrome c biogenesis protein ResB [Verrucomicrobia bacterium]|jgi:hypothetical protein|nr:cytochrome c biogenesis protein ResB [Verrucomicrobiota bacterium]OQC67771.1 MAG: Cytochrome c biogenesis protein Ccs1 [Verrucomicrobia bacterium ADurb.Bin006]MDI9382482.1 cytochrome c biogenesis protein ResB [Verrucomicrobiota bacterium]NMD20691.1 ResB protein required for cytochrome C biosynthesis [Verrucomicrobiota bacterium]HOA60978.1 cytochrome c biogenesis protein ResB [Verrucomicrobiota bacterium]
MMRFFSSIRLTLVCLACAMVLVFAGTLAQVELGLYAAQAKYFRSVLVFWTIPGTSVGVPVLPGGYLVGGVLLINLICAHVQRFGLSRDKLGLLMIHAGLILLLLGQLATDLLSTESTMRLSEGESMSYSEDARHCELAILDTSASDHDLVVAIPETRLARHKQIRHPGLPFEVRVIEYWPNSTHRPIEPGQGTARATQGAGQRVQFVSATPETRMDRRNIPAAYVELVASGGSLGVWAVSLWIGAGQEFQHEGKNYEIALRPARHYRPFALKLLRFSHDKYMGTDIPSNFSSDVHLSNARTGESRDVRIYMNNPLRYGGETFYQSGYDQQDPRVTILQVVRNPGWLTPYFSCVLVGAGLVVQFLSHLVSFVKRRNA